MAQTVQILLRCDLHKEEHEAEDTTTITFLGKTVEVDLCKEALDDLSETLAPIMAVGRRPASQQRAAAASRPRSRATARTSEADTGTKEERAAIREWARANGIDVGERGRLPQAAVEGYTAAQNPAVPASKPSRGRSRANA